jgi:uncharacterized protein
MRKISLLLMLLLIISSVSGELSWVNDDAGVIDSGYESIIVTELENLKANTSVEMAVATVSTTGDTPIEEYSLNLAHNVLGEKGKDNGLLMLVAVDDRQWRIEVGYGLEPYIPDALAGRIGRDMVPYFQQGNYQEGILRGVRAIKSVLMNESGYELTPPAEYTTAKIVQAVSPLVIFLIWLIIFSSFIKRKRHREDEIFRGAALAAILFGGRGRGGLGGSGGFSGFGGFGGGGFGGGGAGGRF